MKLVERPSPNFNDRPAGIGADILVLHYTGMETAGEAMDRLCDSAAQVSAHYTVDEDGCVHAHVAEDKRAWHAGVSHWAGETDVNGRSIGIEIVNPGHEFGYRGFPAPQMNAVEELSLGILDRHPIPSHRVIGHSDVAPERKQDPGELFDWIGLAKAGVGMWPETMEDGESSSLALGDQDASSAGPITNFQTDLLNFGYGLSVDGKFGDHTRLVTIAVQRHFLPNLIGSEFEGVADPKTKAIAKRLSEIATATRSLKGSK
jgi:N-acetylmuramoyl-L-alanine amidase